MNLRKRKDAEFETNFKRIHRRNDKLGVLCKKIEIVSPLLRKLNQGKVKKRERNFETRGNLSYNSKTGLSLPSPLPKLRKQRPKELRGIRSPGNSVANKLYRASFQNSRQKWSRSPRCDSIFGSDINREPSIDCPRVAFNKATQSRAIQSSSNHSSPPPLSKFGGQGASANFSSLKSFFSCNWLGTWKRVPTGVFPRPNFPPSPPIEGRKPSETFAPFPPPFSFQEQLLFFLFFIFYFLVRPN